MTISTARKILGNVATNLSDDELLKEIEFAEFIAELILKQYTTEMKGKGKN